jgi:sec-independent protein translocase protein TatA
VAARGSRAARNARLNASRGLRKQAISDLRDSGDHPRNSGTIQPGFPLITRWSINMFGTLGVPELLIILLIVILIFGANRLPGLAKAMGSTIKNFKEGVKDESADHKS